MPKIRISLLIERLSDFDFGLEVKVLSNAAIPTTTQIAPPVPASIQGRLDFLERLHEDTPVVPPGRLCGRWHLEISAEFPNGILVQRWIVVR